LKYIPAHVLFIEGELFGILLFSIGGFIWFMVPFLDKKAHEGIRTPFWTWFGILLIIYMIVFTAWGYLT
jgi:cytochrome b6